MRFLSFDTWFLILILFLVSWCFDQVTFRVYRFFGMSGLGFEALGWVLEWFQTDFHVFCCWWCCCYPTSDDQVRRCEVVPMVDWLTSMRKGEFSHTFALRGVCSFARSPALESGRTCASLIASMIFRIYDFCRLAPAGHFVMPAMVFSHLLYLRRVKEKRVSILAYFSLFLDLAFVRRWFVRGFSCQLQRLVILT